MAILIDLDQTLIDSRLADPLRRSRQWSKVYPLVPKLQPYPGIKELLGELKNREIPVCIVTASPHPYCQRVISQWKWAIDVTVCYHDTRQHKPHPAPLLLGLQKLGVTPKEAIAIGDAANDTFAARAAGVYSIGALWGTTERQLLFRSKPDEICETVEDLRQFLFERV
jgi:phosphoglycolate phosphatase-like HAD superfamily hydrolase